MRAQRSLTKEVSANLLTASPQLDDDGKPISAEHDEIRLTPAEGLRLIQPYVSRRFMDQLRAVVPLAVYLALFQLLILKQLVPDSMAITGGLFAVILGLMIFMEGLARGLMPLGKIIGSTLPRKSPLPLVLFITLLLGIGVTFAEPAIGALQAAGQNISVERAPYLYALLNDWADALVLVVGASVGLAAVLGTVRFLYGWSLKPLIYLALAPVLALTVYCARRPGSSQYPGTGLGRRRRDDGTRDCSAGSVSRHRHRGGRRQERFGAVRLRHRHACLSVSHPRRDVAGGLCGEAP